MPRKPKDPLAPAPPKRVRKTKKETAAAAALAAAEAKAAAGMMETAYDPLMAGSGMMLMDDVYATHDGYGYYGNGFEPVSYSTATSTPSTMTPTSSGGSQGSMPGGGQQLTPSSTPGSMQGAPGMRPGPGMGTPTPVGIPNGVHPLPHQMPTPTPIEFRIHDMNRRFYLFLNTGVQEKDYAQWWDAFSHEFFDEDAKMTFIVTDEKGMKNEKFVIGRQLIPRYFRTLLDGGMNEMYYVIKGPSRETPTPDGLTTYECNQFMQVSKYELPYQSEVQTDAVIKLDFTPYEECYNYRIRNWVIELQPSQEFTLNPVTREFTPLMLAENKRRPITCGMSPATLQALRFSVILEPMQLIMSTCKGQPQLTPQDALKRICFARHQQQEHQRNMMNAQSAQMMQQQQQQPPPEEAKAKPTRKRTRKAPANPKGAKKGGAPASASPAPSAPFVSPQGIPPAMHFQGMPEVYVVGEPSMLGGEFREDERTIDKLENPNYDPNAAMRPHPAAGTPGMMAPPQMQQPNGQQGPSLAQLQAHHAQLLAAGGGPSPQQAGQPPQPPVSHAHHLAMGNMGPPMTPQQQQQAAHLASLQQQSPQAAHLAQMQAAQQQQGQPPQGVSTPPGAGGMPNGLAPPPPPSGFEYLGGWSRPPTNHLIA